MKYIFYLILIFCSFFLGKALYGPVAPLLFGTNEEKAVVGSMVKEVKVQSPMGTVVETVDLENIDQNDYPSKIILASAVTLTDENGLDPLVLEPGSPVTPLQLVETALTVTSPLATHLTGRVSVFETNFVQEVAQTRMQRRLELIAARDVPAEPVEPPRPEKEAAEEPTQEMVEAEKEKEVMVEVEPEVVEPAELTDEQLIAEMKTSLQSGGVQELAFDSVQSWEVLPAEQFDGQEFRVGLATYQEMTILGQKTLQAKALFREGKLVKWIHAKTGMQIR